MRTLDAKIILNALAGQVEVCSGRATVSVPVLRSKGGEGVAVVLAVAIGVLKLAPGCGLEVSEVRLNVPSFEVQRRVQVQVFRHPLVQLPVHFSLHPRERLVDAVCRLLGESTAGQGHLVCIPLALGYAPDIHVHPVVILIVGGRGLRGGGGRGGRILGWRRWDAW